MASQASWLKILCECERNVRRRITSLRKLHEPQPDLGQGAGGDTLRMIDLAAESAIVSTLRKYRSSFTLISEESGIREYGESPDACYVTTDPVDGSVNATRGVPFYATSVAVSTKPMLGTVNAAVVTDLFHGVTYSAQKGEGAYRNGEKVAPSKSSVLEEAVIGMDMGTFGVQELIPKLFSIVKVTKHVRHFGANALELCYVADGTTDAFVDVRGKLRTTDMAAAWLIVKEAGAKITTPEGKLLEAKLNPKQRVSFVASANPRIHEAILNLMREA